MSLRNAGNSTIRTPLHGGNSDTLADIGVRTTGKTQNSLSLALRSADMVWAKDHVTRVENHSDCIGHE